MEHFDLIIIGGGAAGFGAAVYAGRYELNVVLFEGQKPGGETATGGKFENYPGIVSIDGYDLYQQFRAHAAATGGRIILRHLRWAALQRKDGRGSGRRRCVGQRSESACRVCEEDLPHHAGECRAGRAGELYHYETERRGH